MLDFVISIIEQGLIYAPIVLGVYITYSILDFPDLSVDGTFPLGAAITAVCLTSGVHPVAAILIAVAVGATAGFVTGALHVYLKITNLLCGILVMTALYTVNLRIMGKSNIALFTEQRVFSLAIPEVVIVMIIVIVIKIIFDLFMKTYAGKSLLAVGVNEQLVNTLGVNTGRVKIMGLMIANGLAALSGSLMCQYQKFADIGMGTGTVVIGLAAVIVGKAVFGKAKFLKHSTAVILGSIIYKTSIGVALKLGLRPSDMKLITAVFFVLVIVLQKQALLHKLIAKLKTRKGRQDA